jgi:hypothetical protein
MPAAPALGRHTLLIVDRATRRTGLLSVRDKHPRVTLRERPADGIPGRIAAAHDRLVTVDRLLEDRGVRTSGDASGDPRASVIDNLDAHSPRRQHATHKATLTRKPNLDRLVVILPTQRLTTTVADVVSNYRLAILPADNALATLQLN